jgi:hypothetical protein
MAGGVQACDQSIKCIVTQHVTLRGGSFGEFIYFIRI